jgi:hypothetical protein
MSTWQWITVFCLGGLVAWLVQWALDVVKWNGSQPASGITNDDLREELLQKQRELLELRAKLEQH